MQEIDKKRRQLLFRSGHRGTKEMDLLLGSFALENLGRFDAGQLEVYETILSQNDPDLYNWITGAEDAPADMRGPVWDLILSHRFKNEP